MAIVKTTLNLPDLDRQFMDGLVASGEFISSSEYVCNLVRRDREQRTEVEAIRAKLIKAEQSGFTSQSREEILAEIKGKARHDEEL